MAEKKKKSLISHGVAAQNRKARHDYTINDTIEAGLALVGPEVKSLRAGRATLVDAWAGEREGEMWLFNAYIPEWQAGSFVARFEPRRPRKLLLHRKPGREPTGSGTRAGPAPSAPTSPSGGPAASSPASSRGGRASCCCTGSRCAS